ncbi:hypothetical protein RSOL_219830, partial [Rhizoctonia solani AG-3 Rhs1AP]
MRATYASNAKEAEHLAEKASMQAQSKTKLQGTLVGYNFIELPQRGRPSDLKIPSELSSVIFSPTIPTSPLPQYSYPPQYSPPRPLKELPMEYSPEPQRASTHPVSPPPSYCKEPEPKVNTFDCNNIYFGGKSQAFGRTLPSSRAKAVDVFDCHSIYSLVENHGIDYTLQKPGRLALAASRESRSAKKDFESHKRQTRNQTPKRSEILGLDAEVDDFASDLLEDIAAIGDTGCAATRAAFEHAFTRA